MVDTDFGGATQRTIGPEETMEDDIVFGSQVPAEHLQGKKKNAAVNKVRHRHGKLVEMSDFRQVGRSEFNNIDAYGLDDSPPPKRDRDIVFDDNEI